MPNPACQRALNDLVPALPLTGCNSNVPPLDSPGLALQRYLSGRRKSQEERENRPDPVRTLLERVQASPASEIYKAAFQRYKASLPGAVQIPLTLGGPMAVGLGMSSPIEVGLTTLHTYGMPYIPGSAIKGVCRDVAEELAKLPREEEGHVSAEQFLDLIGDQKSAGLCVFYDAWYVPEGDCKPFHRDVVTVHHPDYYRQKNDAWPTDFDDPTPVPFIVVKPKAEFLFAIKPPSSEWAGFVKDLLVHAMTTHGVGGKTNAGYGWFKEPDEGTPPPPPPPPLAWPDVTITLLAQTGEVSCTNPAGPGKATCKRADLKLTEEQAERLKKKKSLSGVTVTVELIGGHHYRITGLSTS